jgi:hypothetical protein
MAKEGGKLLIKYRDPVAASFSSKDVVMNVQTGTIFYKRNRKLYALRGTPDNFDLVVFPGQSTNQQILFNDSSQTDGSPIMEGSDQFRFKVASATCGCASYFTVGAETLTTFSGSVRIGEHLPGTCNLLDGEVNPALLVHGNMQVSASAGGIGNISASGNISADLDLYGNNAYIHDALIHRNNTDTKLTFGTDTINLYSDGTNIATVSSDRFTINGSNDLYIPGTDSAPTSSTSVLVLDNTTGQVYKTGSFIGSTFKTTGIRVGDSSIDGNLTVTGTITAQEFHTEFVSASIIFSSGSTQFGNSDDDIHTFSGSINVKDNGHITASGNISSSGTLYGSEAYINGHITASGNISASGKLYGGLISSSKPNVVFYNNTTGELTYATSESLATGGTDITVSDEGNSLTTAATSFNFVGNAVTASESSDDVTITINAITKSVWYDAEPTYISSSATRTNVDGQLNVGRGFYGGGGIHDVNISSSADGTGDVTDLGFYGIYNAHTSIGIKQGGNNLFGIRDQYPNALPSSTNPIAIIVGSDNKPNQPKAPNAILIQSQSNIFPTYEGSVGYGIPNVSIGAQGTGSLGKFHVITDAHDATGSLLNDSGLLYNGIIVGPEYNPFADASMKTGSGVFINMHTPREPRILGKTEPGSGWSNNTTLLIHGEQDRSNTYPGGFAGGAAARAPFIEFRATDNTKQAYNASINNTLGNRFTAGGREDTGSINEMFGNGQQWINGLDPPAQNSSLLYQFYNDKMPLLSIEAQGRVGIGNFGENINPKALLHLKAKSSSNADILLQTGNETGSGLPGIKLGSGYNVSNAGSGFGLFSSVNPFGVLRLFTRKNFHNSASNKLYFNQAPDAVYLEAQGVEEGLQKQPYPFNIKGAAKNESEGNNIQLVIGGDGRPFSTSSISTSTLTGNNGTAALTIEGVSDFRRQGEIGIGIITPSSSLHVTRSVQANNFRTTNPVDILIDDSNHSIEMVSASNQVVGTNTTFTSDFKVGDAIKIEGRGSIMSLTGGYTASNGSQTASITSSAGTPGNELIVGDTIQISSSFHTVEGFQLVGGNELILFTPAYNLATTQSLNLIHRTNPNFYQIATIDSIHNDTSMSIEDNWEGNSYDGSIGYKEDILFQVKTADYNPRFTVNAHGDITASGTASFGFLDVTNSSIQTFKDDGVRVGDSSIDGDLTVTGNITAQEFHTEFISSSIIFESGSTQFGNSSDDTHTFSGSIYVKDEGHITASGNISASGLLYSSASLGFDNISIYNSSSGQYFYTSSQGLSNQLDTFKQTGLRTGDGYITGNITGGVNIQVNGGDPENYLAGALNIGLTGRPSSLGDDVSYFKGSLIVGRHQGGINPDNRILQGTAASLIVGQGNIVTNQFANSIVMGIFNSGSGLANFVGGSNHNKGLSDATMVFGYGNHNEDNDGGIVLGSYNHISATSTNGHHAIGNHLVNSGSLVGSIVLGMYNTHGVTDAIFTIGQGTDSLRKDLLVARSGSIEIIGHITASENISASGEVIAASANITNITASGNISASGTLYGSEAYIKGHITASGNISASGTLFSSSSLGFDNISIYNSSSGQYFYTSSQGLSNQLDTFKQTGVRTGDSILSGSLIIRPLPPHSGYQTASLKIWGHGQGVAEIHLSQDGDGTPGRILRYNGISDNFEINKEDGTTQLAIDPSGTVRIPGAISSSGGVWHGGLTFGTAGSLVTMDPATGEFKRQAIKGAIAIGIPGLLSSSFQIESDISGSWQGQGFISASQTFLSTGQRNGDSAITGSFEVTSDITGSNQLLIRKSSGEGTPTIGTSNVAIFQNNTTGQDASISIIGADDKSSRIHFGKHDKIDVGGIRYFHEDHLDPSLADRMLFRVNNNNVVAIKNVNNKGYIGTGGDHLNPTNFFHAQGTLSGNGLMLSSSNGAGITIDRKDIGSNSLFNFLTGGVFKWVLGNQAESNDNLYIYSGTNTKHVTFTPTSTNFHTSISASGNITASGNISASGTLSAGLTQATSTNIAYYDTSTGLFTYELATLVSGFTAAGISGSWQSQYFNTLTTAGISGSWQSQYFNTLTAAGISGSWQSQYFNTLTAAGISGSFTLTSASIATNIATNVTNIATNTSNISTLNSSGLLSSSFQIESDISGSWQGQEFVSASQTFLSTGQRSGDSAITGSFEVTNNITASGNISASGTGSFGMVGIGTTAPVVKLDIRGSAENLRIISTTAGNTHIGYGPGTSAAGNYFSFEETGATYFRSYNGTTHTTRMFISGSGNVGIGDFATVPQAKLSVTDYIDGSNNVAFFKGKATTADDATTISIHNGFSTEYTKEVKIGAVAESISSNITGMALYTSPNSAGSLERVRIDGTGNVGIGTTTPTEALTVVGNISASGNLSVNQLTASADLHLTTANIFTPAGTVDFFNIGGAAKTIRAKSAQFSTGYSGTIPDNGILFSTDTSLRRSEALTLTSNGNISASNFIAQNNITASGNISASGKLYGGLASTITPSAVYYNPVGGELSYGTGFTAAGISGSWQSQPFANLSAVGISGSFLLNTTDTLTGTLTIQAPTMDSTLLLSSVGTSNDSIVQLRQSNTTGFDVKYDGGVDKFQIKNNSNYLPFQIEHVTPTNTLYLSGSGNVGIGTSSPTAKLHVAGNIWASGSSGHITASGNISASGTLNVSTFASIQDVDTGNPTPAADETRVSGYGIIGNRSAYYITNANTGSLIFGVGGAHAAATKMTILNSGNVGIGTTNPLEKLVVDSGADDLIARFQSTTAEDIVKGIRINAKDAGGASTYLDLVVDPLGNKIGLGIGTTGGNLPIGDADLSQAELVIDSSGNVGIGTDSPGEKLEVIGNISASGTLSAGLTQASGSHITYYNTSSGLFTYEVISDPPIDKIRFSGLNLGDTTVDDDGGNTAEFILSGSSTLGIKVRGDAATSTIGIELSTVSLPEITNFDHVGNSISNEDSFVVHDVSTGVAKRILAGNISMSAFNQNLGYVTTSGVTSVGTNAGLSGTVTSTGNLSLDLNGLTTIVGSMVGGDDFAIVDGTNSRKIQAQNVPLSILNNNLSMAGTNINQTSNGANFDFAPGGNAHGVYFNTSSATMDTPTSDFTYNSSGNGVLRVGGDIVAFSSDKRLKENIVVISDPIEKIKQLRGVTYDWKDSTLNLGFKTQRQYNEIGLIAQELEKVIPQAIYRAPFDNKDNPKLYVSGSRIDGETEPYKTIKMEKVIPLLIEGIKDQQKQIDELKELVAKLINK